MTAPTAIGRYQVMRELGRGAMGTVYLARDSSLGRLVALKTFRGSPIHGDPEDSAISRRRMLREAQQAGMLSHPSIVTVYDVVEAELPGEGFYIVMEYVEGWGLDARLRDQGPMPLDRAAACVAQIASALDHLHSRGIVHRDVKPANVLGTDDGRFKITDFGVSRSEDPSQTMEEAIFGTPQYMAPEQIQGKPLDPRTDVFSLGVVLYEMLTGKKPFPGATVAEVTHRIVYDDPVAPAVDGKPLPSNVRSVLAGALAKDPAERYPSAGALAAAVQSVAASHGALDAAATTALPRGRWLATAPGAARTRFPRAWVVAAVAVLLAAGLLAGPMAFIAWQRGGEESASSEQQARQVGYVKLIAEGRRQLNGGDPQAAALLFQAAEGLAVDPAGARRLSEEARRRAEERGAQLKLLDARKDLQEGRYDQVIATARQMMDTGAGREQAMAVLAEVQQALAREKATATPGSTARAASAPPRTSSARRPAPAAAPPPDAAPTPDHAVLRVDFQSASPEGILTVWLDGRQVVREPFSYYQRDGIFHKRAIPGSWATDMSVRPGAHTLRVLVALSGKPAQVSTFDAPIAPGESRTLAISMPATGALRVELR